jgi:hypothetical protein
MRLSVRLLILVLIAALPIFALQVHELNIVSIIIESRNEFG